MGQLTIVFSLSGYRASLAYVHPSQTSVVTPLLTRARNLSRSDCSSAACNFAIGTINSKSFRANRDWLGPSPRSQLGDDLSYGKPKCDLARVAESPKYSVGNRLQRGSVEPKIRPGRCYRALESVIQLAKKPAKKAVEN